MEEEGRVSEEEKREQEIPKLAREVQRLSLLLERMGVGFFLDLHRRPWKLFWVNLLAGMGRGIGFVLGAAALVAVISWLLKPFFSIPVLGKWIAKIAQAVRQNMLRGIPPQ